MIAAKISILPEKILPFSCCVVPFVMAIISKMGEVNEQASVTN
jgi:hypothetical protein